MPRAAEGASPATAARGTEDGSASGVVGSGWAGRTAGSASS
uniref:Uncharacterized protein n=1 Tax=Arundo donax TaxID=35708 RepID=A0A0A9IKB9_ARUDO